MRGWRAWYIGEDTFTSADTKWTALPPYGVLGVVVYLDAPYRSLVSGGDWYYLDDGRPACTDTTWGGWVDPPDVPPAELKRGAATTDDRWREIETEMMDARTWP